MVDLGPLFKDRSITGPIAVQYVRLGDKHISIVGEAHTVHGNLTNIRDHAIEQIKAFGADHETACFLEHSLMGSRMNAQNCLGLLEGLEKDTGSRKHFAEIPRSPIQIYSLYFHTENMPCHTTMADIRHSVPYDIVTLLYYPHDYAALHNYSNTDAIKTDMKVAEKELLKRLKTRNDAKRFLKSLFMPDREYANWFVSLFRKLSPHATDSNPPDALRGKMRTLKTQKPKIYKKLVLHITSYEHYWASSPYTAAVDKIEQMRHTDVKTLFVEMFTFLVDINIVCDLFLTTIDRFDHVVILVGLNHLWNLARLFDGMPGVLEMSYKCDYGGNIQAGPAQLGAHIRTGSMGHIERLKNR
jgi:hypothetical protein